MLRLSSVAQGNAGIYQTVRVMLALLRRSSPRADRLSFSLAQTAGASALSKAAAVHGWILDHVDYVADDALAALHDLSDDVQDLVTEPELMLAQVENQGHAEEDCDGFALLSVSLLHRLGVAASFVLASTRADRAFDHIYVIAHTEYGPTPLDGIQGQPCGWEAETLTAREEIPTEIA